MLRISNKIMIPLDEVDIRTARAQGPGGQHVNKVSTAIQLRFDINRSSLPEIYKKRLLQLNDRRITSQGIITIKAQRYKSQHRNKNDALLRLSELIRSVLKSPKKRLPTKPTTVSKEKRLKSKSQRSQLKIQRQKITNFGDTE